MEYILYAKHNIYLHMSCHLFSAEVGIILQKRLINFKMSINLVKGNNSTWKYGLMVATEEIIERDVFLKPNCNKNTTTLFSE